MCVKRALLSVALTAVTWLMICPLLHQPWLILGQQKALPFSTQICAA